jgi:diguanylate cyclase (GGDEF)-like protein
MVDVDHFKKINDSHGHPVGDEVLRVVASTLERVIRGKGVAYRYGGEEFALLLPNHSCEEAVAVAERARLAVEAALVAGIRVTASFGAAAVPAHAAAADDWLKKADSALYDAKRRGRNLVRFFGEPAPQSDQPKPPGPPRKSPKPGEISDDEKERLRRAILKHGGAYCPVCEDEIPLSAHDVTTHNDSGKSFLVNCPACGFNTNLSSPRR